MPAILTWQYRVTERDIDEQGHVNNLEYLRWMQSAAFSHSEAQGWGTDRYVTEGSSWVVRTHFIEYLAPAFAGEEIEVRTWVTGFHKVTSLRRYHIVRPLDSVLLATAETNWAYISRQHGVPRRIPAELAASFISVPDDSPESPVQTLRRRK